jgi:bifunctional non-homologous end joining protein LigD
MATSAGTRTPTKKKSASKRAVRAAPVRATKATKATKATPRKAPKKAARARTAAEPRVRTRKSTQGAATSTTRARAKSKPGDGAVVERLEKYRSMRDFERTPEPSGTPRPSAAGELSFVIQKHAASHLHYDFRLELDGVLLSWSVPKGPSLRPGDRRLAVRTEDHPFEYADFEGIIPKGEYGGGTVIVWDRGRWLPDGDPRDGVKKGKLTFALVGEKLSGRFHLARTRLEGGKREHWLLFKGKDEGARADSDIVSERPESVLSGRTVEQVAAAPDRVWHSNRAEKSAPSKRASGAVTATSSRTSKATKAAVAAAPSDVVALVKRLPLSFSLTSLEKVLYPEQNLRKAELIAYYASVASTMLPHVSERPLTLVRCPHGRAHKCFYQKHANEGVPACVRRVAIHEERKVEEYMTIHDMDGLVALAQMGVLEIHTWVGHADAVEQPDQFVFDIDPDEGLPWDQVVEAAVALRARLEDVGLTSFVKTTGGKGLHVVAPVSRALDWEQHKEVARAVSESIAREQPRRYLTSMRKALRKGKVFLDYFRNGRGATAIAPYSTRARVGATVATPLTWEELARGVKPSELNIYTVMRRLGEQGDPWKDYGKVQQSLRAPALRLLGVRK